MAVRSTVRSAVAVALGVLLIGLAVALARSEPRLAFTNARGLAAGTIVPPGREMCQDNEFVPGEAAQLRLALSTAGRVAGPLQVRVLTLDRRRVTGGRSHRPFRDELVTVPLTPVRRLVDQATLCVRNAGRTRVAVLGDPVFGPRPVAGTARLGPPSPAGRAARVPGFRQPQPSLARVEWLRPGSESWIQLSPTLAERFGLVKASFLGPWTMWAMLALLLTAAALAVRLLLRVLPR